MTPRSSRTGPYLKRTFVFLYIGSVIALPIGMIFSKAVRDGPLKLWQSLTDPQALYAFRLTFMAAGIVTVINIILGTISAFALVRFKFPGRKWIDPLIDLPFAIPTSVIGLTLALLLGPKSPLGAWLQTHGFTILYQPSAIYIALLVVTLPFVIRSVQPLLRSIDPTEEEAAITLGARPFKIFTSVIFPVIRPGIISGAVLTFARSLGEFGVVVFVAGTQPFHTEVAATYIFSKIEQFDFQGAASASVVVLLLSYLLLWTMRFFEAPLERRMIP
ncbi:MAG: sulfate ABC transporter permease subunit CysT [Chlamydiae bacterium]|nr:sulfate ABC transporter permease subunit CysT [Chlamydiota bacterium]MBI3266978.1 sulfate ABC transporter permease subunit CysT [Chlamydiota bacterium]